MENNLNIGVNSWKDKTILIAEDEDSNYRFLEMVLIRTGVRIIWAQDGVQAIEMAKNNNPDLILMDIKMPVMDGLEATREIKKIMPDVPIIAQTAYAMESDEKICFDVGCSDYLSKPIRAKKLIEVVAKYLNESV